MVGESEKSKDKLLKLLGQPGGKQEHMTSARQKAATSLDHFENQTTV